MQKEVFSSKGYGLGFRPSHYEEILQQRPAGLDWLEVISENFMGAGGLPFQYLTRAREMYPIAFHGVGLSIGSPESTRVVYLKELKELVHNFQPFVVSDHLSFSSFDKHNSHDLLPIPYTETTLRNVKDKVNRVQDFLGRTILLENPSAYVSFRSSEIPEAEFLMELCKATGCGILLDLNNLFVNQSNLGMNPLDYLLTLSSSVVGQIHLAGHSVETSDLGTVRIDTHDHPVSDEVWNLLEFAKHRFEGASVMIEWDDKIPPLSDLMRVLTKAREVVPTEVYTVGVTSANLEMISQNYSDQEKAQAEFFSIVTGLSKFEIEDPRLGYLHDSLPVARLLGSRVYNNAYLSRISEAVANTFQCLRRVLTDFGFREIVVNYLENYPPQSESANDLGCDLPLFLSTAEFTEADFGVSAKQLSELAAFDWARHKAFFHPSFAGFISPSALTEISDEKWSSVSFQSHPTLQVLHLSLDPFPVLESVHEAIDLPPPTFGTFRVAVWRLETSVQQRLLTDVEYSLLNGILKGLSFMTIVELAGNSAMSEGLGFEARISAYSEALLQVFRDGMISEIT